MKLIVTISWLFKMFSIFGLCFLLYYLKLLSGSANIRISDPDLHRLAIKYQRFLHRRDKAELDLNFLYKYKEYNVYPNFVKWKHITKQRKKTRYLLYRILLNDTLQEKKSNLAKLSTSVREIRGQLTSKTTWMKFKLICFSIRRLQNEERKKIQLRHDKKLHERSSEPKNNDR